MSTDSSLSRERYMNNDIDINLDLNEKNNDLIPSSRVVIPTSILNNKGTTIKKSKLKKHNKEGPLTQSNGNNNNTQLIKVKRARSKDNDCNSIDNNNNNGNGKKQKRSHTHTKDNEINSKYINLYSYVTKTDRQKVMMRIEMPQTEEKLILYQTFQSLRNDYWKFCITHEPSLIKNQGGKLSIEIIVQKCKRTHHNHHDNNNNNTLPNIFDIQFDIDLTINVINHKSTSFLIQDMNYNNNNNTSNSTPNTYKEEIIIPQEVYSIINKSDNNNLISLIELSITKKYNTFFNSTNSFSFSQTGIINEGATCYMNSMLQTLNAIGSFKKNVFQIPTEGDDYNSIVLSLQRLFYDLMKNNCLASTKILLQSFGWTKEQIQIQHDVQEFNLLLSEVMEKKVKDTQCEGFYNKLFEGKIKNYIQCLNVDYKSERIEKFNDLQLTIKGNKNIYESLDSYTEEEILDNEDKYEADGYGKQKAKKGIKFISFPSVLTLQLKRFEYNSKKEMMIKINDYFEYDEEIDLKKYLSKDHNKDKNNNSFNSENNTHYDNKDDYIYTLHSVVVHQGNANSGHYYAYIKPTTSNFWILYNDDIVRPADAYELFHQNFGGNYQMYKHKGKGDIVSTNVFFERSAYILVYIKKSEEKSIMEPVTEETVPLYLRKRFENEKQEELQIQKKKKRNNENVNVLLLSNQNCFEHDNKLGIVNSFLDLNYDAPFIYNQSNRMLLSFPKQITVELFLLFVSQCTNIPMNNMLLYEYNNSDSFMVTSRQEFELLPFNDEILKTTTLIDYKTNNKKQYICFYLYVYEPYELFTPMSSLNDVNMRNECESESKCEYEYEYGDNKIVYIPKNYNQLCFKKNNEAVISSMSNKKRNDLIPISALDSRIIFVKKYDKESNRLSLILNFHILYDPNKDDSYHYMQIIEGINDFRGLNPNIKSKSHHHLITPFKSLSKYLIEKASLCNWKNYSSLELTRSNINDILIDNNSLIIIPIEDNYSYEEVEEYINNLNNIFYVDIYSIYGIKLLKKIQINLKPKVDECHLRNTIVNLIKEKHLMYLMIKLKDHYYINKSREICQVTEQYLYNTMSSENIALIDISDGTTQRQTAEIKEYPLLAYFNQSECKFAFSFSLYQLSNLNDFYYQDLYLYDNNNNEVCLISVIIPKKIKRCNEILDYLYEPINSMFPSGFNKQKYYFILQNQSREYVYQIITDCNKEFKVYESKAKDIEYRLQPFEDSQRMRFDSNDYKKVFLTIVQYKKIKIDPMVIYLHKNASFFSIKNDVSALVMRNNKYSLITLESEVLLIQITRGKMKDGKIIKDTREVIKEDDSLEYIFRDYSGVLNFVIEFVQ